ncbi:hypothetical protein AKO1_006809 [Acrasis kona]|uniref:Uncharacterized protein n=1 Tax=Acrasis kona TaxID=1008807 RepID=A0AAW2YUL5_9EUKA
MEQVYVDNILSLQDGFHNSLQLNIKKDIEYTKTGLLDEVKNEVPFQLIIPKEAQIEFECERKLISFINGIKCSNYVHFIIESDGKPYMYSDEDRLSFNVTNGVILLIRECQDLELNHIILLPNSSTTMKDLRVQISSERQRKITFPDYDDKELVKFGIQLFANAWYEGVLTEIDFAERNVTVHLENTNFVFLMPDDLNDFIEQQMETNDNFEKIIENEIKSYQQHIVKVYFCASMEQFVCSESLKNIFDQIVNKESPFCDAEIVESESNHNSSCVQYPNGLCLVTGTKFDVEVFSVPDEASNSNSSSGLLLNICWGRLFERHEWTVSQTQEGLIMVMSDDLLGDKLTSHLTNYHVLGSCSNVDKVSLYSALTNSEVIQHNKMFITKHPLDWEKFLNTFHLN